MQAHQGSKPEHQNDVGKTRVATETSVSISSEPLSQTFSVYGTVFKVDARYQYINALGKGSYGVVCSAKDLTLGRNIAIKKVAPMTQRTTDAKRILREVRLLKLLGDHPNVIALHNVHVNVKEDELYLVLDLMDTDLHRVLQSSQALSEAHIQSFMLQLLHGVRHLHANGVLHRDLKPGNLLLTKNCQLKIADFGLARKIPQASARSLITGLASNRPRSAPTTARGRASSATRAPMTEHVVTRWYRAPELMLQPDGIYDESIDMWAVGCILAEILGRKALFPGKNFLHQLSLIFDVLGSPPADLAAGLKSAQAQRFVKSLGSKPRVSMKHLFPTASNDALDLLDKLLQIDPNRRLSASEAIAHPYLQAADRKYRNKYSPATLGTDGISARTRMDFSFDVKNLIKSDLKALILQEAGNTLKTESSEKTAPSVGKVVTANMNGKSDDRIIKVSSIHTNSIIESHEISEGGKSEAVQVHCGPAGSSMRRRSIQQEEIRISGEKEGTNDARGSIGQTIRLGSGRHRIHALTKPSVPRQQSASKHGPSLQSSECTKPRNSIAGFVHIIPSVCPTAAFRPDAAGAWGSSTPLGDRKSMSALPKADATVVSGSVAKAGVGQAAIEDKIETRDKQPIDKVPRRQGATSSSSSSSPSAGSPPNSTEMKPSRAKPASNDHSRPKHGPSNPPGFQPPRQRAQSAGPNRSKSLSSSNNRFVGSASSLLRAHRRNENDKTSVADATATATRAKARPSTACPKKQTGTHHPATSKRLTVPRSPKFSVMSWQKKKTLPTRKGVRNSNNNGSASSSYQDDQVVAPVFHPAI